MTYLGYLEIWIVILPQRCRNHWWNAINHWWFWPEMSSFPSTKVVLKKQNFATYGHLRQDPARMRKLGFHSLMFHNKKIWQCENSSIFQMVFSEKSIGEQRRNPVWTPRVVPWPKAMPKHGQGTRVWSPEPVTSEGGDVSWAWQKQRLII